MNWLAPRKQRVEHILFIITVARWRRKNYLRVPVDELSSSSNHLDFNIIHKASFERDLRDKVRNYVFISWPIIIGCTDVLCIGEYSTAFG